MKTGINFCITFIIFLFIFPRSASAQNANTPQTENNPVVYTSINPEPLSPGKPFTLTLLVDYPVPEDVNVIAPPFSGFLTLDRFIKSPRITETRTQTVFEYRLIPKNTGLFVLESFTVVCPGGITEAGPFVLNIRAEGDAYRILVPRISWEEAPRQLATGERALLTLRANDWNEPGPPPEFFMPQVPQGVILALAPLTAQERESGIAAKFTLIPVTVGDFRLGARSLQYENFRFEIPALQIRINNPASSEPIAHNNGDGIEDAFEEQARFPELVFSTPKSRRIETIYNTARDLWNSGFRARALAHLRRHERDHHAGAYLVPIRRQAEENLRIFNGGDENRLERKLLLVLLSFVIFIVIIIPFICFIMVKKFPGGKRVLFCAVIFSALVSFFLFLLADARIALQRKGGRFGVTTGTPVRNTADTDAKELFVFREGQPVMILLKNESWVYVMANDTDGNSGWIPAEAVEFY